MDNRLIIDWFSFSLRIDPKSAVKFDGRLELDFFCQLLGIPFGEFSYCGKVKYYKERYECNNISISVPYERSELSQGFNVNMSGAGCRYFEQCQKDGEMIDALDIWRNFFLKLRALTKQGLSLTISRIDNAIDDFTGTLDLDKIVNCCRLDLVATRFRSSEATDGKSDKYRYLSEDYLVTESFCNRLRGLSVTFGKRISNTFCRFYDKKAERMAACYRDENEMKLLEAIPHWVRMEFEFKDQTAIKIVNSICDENDYPKFFSMYVNGMIRFIDRDDSNISRCTTKKWWSDFVGTAERTNLAVGDYKPVTAERHLDYVYKNMSGVIYTAMNIDGVDKFLHSVIEIASHKLKPKYQRLCEGIERKLKDFCSAEMWDILKPRYNKIPSPHRGDYWYSQQASRPDIWGGVGCV